MTWRDDVIVTCVVGGVCVGEVAQHVHEGVAGGFLCERVHVNTCHYENGRCFAEDEWTECTAEIETATASLLKLHHVVNLLPLLSPEVT